MPRPAAQLIERHRVACAGFSRVAALVRPDQWDAPTPCTEWDAGAVVEHVIGFHEFLLIRPLGVRAHRPRTGPAARWAATSTALFAALDVPGTVDRVTELPGGGHSSPRTMLDALTVDVLVHTWDLARAADLDPELDHDLCVRAYDTVRVDDVRGTSDMFAVRVQVPSEADAATQLVAAYGRDPGWVSPRPRGPRRFPGGQSRAQRAAGGPSPG
ncbi:MAG: TIGR03086 family metal-binding protein [Acidimicrobiia bacterium]